MIFARNPRAAFQNSWNEKLPACQIVLFIGTNNSLDSIYCKHELELALRHDIEIIPIKGSDLKQWTDLDRFTFDVKDKENTKLSDQKGVTWNSDDFDAFCKELFGYVMQVKTGEELFEPGKALVKKELKNIKNTINNYLNSEDFQAFLDKNLIPFQELFEQLANGSITQEQFILEFAKIINNPSQSN